MTEQLGSGHQCISPSLQDSPAAALDFRSPLNQASKEIINIKNPK